MPCQGGWIWAATEDGLGEWPHCLVGNGWPVDFAADEDAFEFFSKQPRPGAGSMAVVCHQFEHGGCVSSLEKSGKTKHRRFLRADFSPPKPREGGAHLRGLGTSPGLSGATRPTSRIVNQLGPWSGDRDCGPIQCKEDTCVRRRRSRGADAHPEAKQEFQVASALKEPFSLRPDASGTPEASTT